MPSRRAEEPVERQVIREARERGRVPDGEEERAARDRRPKEDPPIARNGAQRDERKRERHESDSDRFLRKRREIGFAECIPR